MSSFRSFSSPSEWSIGLMKKRPTSGEGPSHEEQRLSSGKGNALLKRMRRRHADKVQKNLSKRKTAIVDLFGAIPSQASFVNIGMVQQLCARNSWLDRTLILAEHGLYVTNDAVDRCYFEIPFQCINQVSLVELAACAYEERYSPEIVSQAAAVRASTLERRRAAGAVSGAERCEGAGEAGAGVGGQSPRGVLTGAATWMANGDDEEGEGEDSEELGFFVSIAGDHTRNSEALFFRVPPDASPWKGRAVSSVRENGGQTEWKQCLRTHNTWRRGASCEGGGQSHFQLWRRALSAGEWVVKIQAQCGVAEANTKSLLDKVRGAVGTIYFGNTCQLVIAILIFGNFVSSAIESQFVPETGTPEQELFQWIEVSLTMIFGLELCVHIFLLRLDFFRCGWNNLDLMVVATSLVATFSAGIHGLSTLRIVRALRVLRLFGRLRSIRRIVDALFSSWFPVVNAFAIIMFMIAIYAILGVSFFRHRSARLFENFSTSFFTMFTVMTMESWVELLRVDLALEQDVIDPSAAFFFISFILIVAWTTLPVVIAIMLSNFIDAARKEDAHHKEAQVASSNSGIVHCLDPVMQVLANFTSVDDLRDMIAQLFEVLDVYEAGSLSFDCLRTALLHLHISHHAIKLRWEDFLRLTNGGKLCTASGGLSPQEFERAMVRELKAFVQRRLASAMTIERDNSNFAMVALLGEAKLQHCLQEVHHMQEMQMLAGRALSDPRPTFPIGSSYNVVNYYTPSSPLFRPNTSSRPGARRASWAAGASRHRWSTASSPDAEGGDSRVPPLHEGRSRAGPQQQAMGAALEKGDSPAPSSPLTLLGLAEHTVLPLHSAVGDSTRRETAAPHMRARKEQSEKRKGENEDPSGKEGKAGRGESNGDEDSLSDLRRSVLLLQEVVVGLSQQMNELTAYVHKHHPSSNAPDPAPKASRRPEIYLQPTSAKGPLPEMLVGSGGWNRGSGAGGACGLCKVKAGTELCLDCGRILCWPCRGKHAKGRATRSHMVISRNEGEGMEGSVVPLDGGRVRVTCTPKQARGPALLPGSSHVSAADSNVFPGRLGGMARGEIGQRPDTVTGSEGAALGRMDGEQHDEDGERAGARQMHGGAFYPALLASRTGTRKDG